jgi:endonuclease-8
MPEGPTIVILKEEVESFKGKTVLNANGNTKHLNFDLLQNQRIIDFKSFGKNFFIYFPAFSVRIHFMLFGSYRINERKTSPVRLSLQFEDAELNFYTCVVELIERPLEELYDFTADVMNPAFNAQKAIDKLRVQPQLMVCDALLDQHIFAGVGNIIKNEVLFRIRINPLSMVGNIPDVKLDELAAEAVNYSFDFLMWKKEYTLKKHWLAHTKKICPRDHVAFVKEYTGKTRRRSFYCTVCQQLY